MFDIIFFEALGEEAQHLAEELAAAQEKALLPANLRAEITPLTLQEYLAANPAVELPEIISIKTHSVPPESWLRSGVKKSILSRSAGYDHVEHLAEIANVTSLRNYCVNAVAQTAIKFLYCTAGYLNHYTENAKTFERNRTASFRELGPHLTATVFGCGRIGKRLYELAEANGLNVQAVDLRADELDKLYGGSVKFVSPEEAIRTSDIILNAMNLTRIPESRFYNVGYFSEEYLRKGKKGLLFVNVTRGEIAPEAGLLRLYREGRILGIGLDTFSHEPAFTALIRGQGGTDEADVIAAAQLLEMAVNRTGNVYVQPHQGFNSDIAAATKATDAIQHLIAWYALDKKRFDEQLPYYA